MNIAKNLQYLRKRDKITQEDLADKLGVSRQSVSKWETGEAYPETEKLLSLCELFNVSLDDLMRGDISATATVETEDAEPQQATEIKAFHAHINKFSLGISLGVALILIGVALCVLLAGISFTLIEPYSELTAIMGGVAVILFVAPAVFLFVFNGIMHDRFQKAHPVIESPAAPKAELFSKRFPIAMALLISGILLDTAFLVVMTSFIETGIISVSNTDAIQCYITAAFLAALGCIVGGIVYLGIRRSKYNIEEYNKQTRATLNPSPRDKLAGAIGGIIMMSATALFLILGFTCKLWHPAWIVFPVCGILCGIVRTALNAKNRDK